MEAVQHYILFSLAGTTYAVKSGEVQQMDMVEQITPVPDAPPSVEGVVFLRGQVIPVINLRARFGFPRVDYDLKTRLIVVRIAERSAGLIVDSAREFVEIADELIQPPPDAIAGLRGKYLEGIANIGERLVMLLNCEEVINPADMLAEPPRSSDVDMESENTGMNADATDVP